MNMRPRSQPKRLDRGSSARDWDRGAIYETKTEEPVKETEKKKPANETETTELANETGTEKPVSETWDRGANQWDWARSWDIENAASDAGCLKKGQPIVGADKMDTRFLREVSPWSWVVKTVPVNQVRCQNMSPINKWYWVRDYHQSEKWGTGLEVVCPTELFGPSRPSSTRPWECKIK